MTCPASPSSSAACAWPPVPSAQHSKLQHSTEAHPFHAAAQVLLDAAQPEPIVPERHLTAQAGSTDQPAASQPADEPEGVDPAQPHSLLPEPQKKPPAADPTAQTTTLASEASEHPSGPPGTPMEAAGKPAGGAAAESVSEGAALSSTTHFASPPPPPPPGSPAPPAAASQLSAQTQATPSAHTDLQTEGAADSDVQLQHTAPQGTADPLTNGQGIAGLAQPQAMEAGAMKPLNAPAALEKAGQAQPDVPHPEAAEAVEPSGEQPAAEED